MALLRLGEGSRSRSRTSNFRPVSLSPREKSREGLSEKDTRSLSLLGPFLLRSCARRDVRVCEGEEGGLCSAKGKQGVKQAVLIRFITITKLLMGKNTYLCYLVTVKTNIPLMEY